MLISTRGRYALRVMVDIAENGKEGYIAMKDVARCLPTFPAWPRVPC